MAVFAEKRCPHCGRPYKADSSQRDWDGLRGPFRICDGCGKEFVDKDFREPAFYDAPQRERPWKDFLTPLWPFGIAGIFGIVIAVGAANPYYLLLSVVPFGFYFYIVFKKLQSKNKEYKKELEAYRLSRQRVSDRGYIIRLLDGGYRVPKFFLTRMYPDLVNYTPGQGAKIKRLSIFLP